jgi:signal peptidase I
MAAGLLLSSALQSFYIPSESMFPTLREGDRVLAFNVNRGWTPAYHPRRGDVVVFSFPFDLEAEFVKRVIALPGERVAVVGDRVLVNGQPLALTPAGPCAAEAGEVPKPCRLVGERAGDRDYVTRISLNRPEIALEGMLVPQGQLFVMGDDRRKSVDSRTLGTVPIGLVRARVLGLWWSSLPARGWRPGASVMAGMVERVDHWFARVRWARLLNAVE